MTRLLSVISILTAATSCTGVYGQFVLVTDQRVASVNAELFDGVDGDFDFSQDGAVPFQPFDTSLSGSASYAGVQAQCSATQSSFTTTDTIAIFCDTYAEITAPGQLDSAIANAQTSASVHFELTETADVLFQVEKSSTGSSQKIQGISSFELWREIPCPTPCDTDDDCVTMLCQGDPNPGDGVAEGICVFDSCILANNQTGPCGVVMRLEPGTYSFQIGAIASAASFGGSQPNGGSASATILGVITHLGLTQAQFTVEPVNSPATLDVIVPGLPAQTYPLTLAGTVGTALGGCDEIEMTMTEFNVQPQETQIEIDLPGGGSVIVSDLSVVLGDTMPTAVLSGGAGTFTDYEISVLGVVSPGPEQGGLGAIAFAIIQACNALAIGPGRCVQTTSLPNGMESTMCHHAYWIDCEGDLQEWTPDIACGNEGSGGIAGGLPAPTLTFPSFSVSGTADLGLGAMNPTFIVTGDITASMPETPCPWDCGDGDGNVGIIDFLALLAQWGDAGTGCDLGLGGPGVGIDEFLALLAAWGPCP